MGRNGFINRSLRSLAGMDEDDAQEEKDQQLQSARDPVDDEVLHPREDLARDLSKRRKAKQSRNEASARA